MAWLDTGTHASLMEASHFVHAIECRQGLKIACLEEIGFNNGWLLKENLIECTKVLSKTNYGQYLVKLAMQ
jgi:glucose-1-phosphate thymidylyltransferase